ncbi:MAG: hypothetical protein R3F02_17970 [Thiolinea sp.]
MNNYKKMWWVPMAVAGLAVLADFSMAAVDRTLVSITSQVNELVQQVDANGQMQLAAVSPERIVPGDRVLYTTHIANNGVQASENIVVTNPIPEHVSYLGGTAQGENFTIVYSVDGGQSWGQPEQLQVRQADGQIRQAKPEEYTHIRWQYRAALQPAEVQQISYQAQLK